MFWFSPGRMENDVDNHTDQVTSEVAEHHYIHIPVTGAQADKIRAAIDARTTHPGRYNLIFRNCAGAVGSFLHAGGVSGVPHSEIFVPAVLIQFVLARESP